jgi:hypothetical protein
MSEIDGGTPATPGGSGGASSATLAALQAQYFYLDRNFNRLFAAATSDEQRDELRADYVQARENYWKARTEAFNDDDPMVAGLRQKVTDAQQQIERSGQRIGDVAALLDLITGAVNFGSRLVSLAAV